LNRDRSLRGRLRFADKGAIGLCRLSAIASLASKRMNQRRAMGGAPANRRCVAATLNQAPG